MVIHDFIAMVFDEFIALVGFGGVFGFLDADRHVALRVEVLDFVGLGLLNDADEAGAIGKVAAVQEEAHILIVPVSA